VIARPTGSAPVDFANARKADQVRLSSGGSYGLFGRVNGSVDFTYQSLDVAGGRLLTARLTQGQVVYHLNLRTVVRAILQYTDITRDPTLYRSRAAPETRRLFSQCLGNRGGRPGAHRSHLLHEGRLRVGPLT
jgi:hypothetical protein